MRGGKDESEGERDKGLVSRNEVMIYVSECMEIQIHRPWLMPKLVTARRLKDAFDFHIEFPTCP
jgi:hypothetical protein